MIKDYPYLLFLNLCKPALLSKVLFWLAWSLIYLTINSCGQEAMNSYPSQSGSLVRSSLCWSKVPSHRLRQSASNFSQLSPKSRPLAFDRYKLAIERGQIPTDRTFQHLLEYFSDSVDPNLAPVDGSQIQFRSASHVRNITIDGVAPSDRIFDNSAVADLYWSGYLIPQHMMVKNYPLFRGNRELISTSFDFYDEIDPKSEFAQKLQKLFSYGLQTKKSAGNSQHQDIFLHTLDSENSSFLASTMDFETALRFGIDPDSQISAVVEFRGIGVDVNKTSAYFDSYSFLKAGKSQTPFEREIVVTSDILPKDIRGVWVFTNKLIFGNKQVFIANPNFEK